MIVGRNPDLVNAVAAALQSAVPEFLPLSVRYEAAARAEEVADAWLRPPADPPWPRFRLWGRHK